MSRSALVTGGARRIGKAIANTLAENGFHIYLHYFHSADQAEVTAQQIRQSGSSCDTLQADLQDAHAIAEMMDEIRKKDTGLQVLVNNASVFQQASLDDTKIDEWDQMMQVNLRAPWLCVKSARDLLQKNNGCVINMLDSGIEKIWTNHAAYQLSKVGLAHLTKLMAKEYAPMIRVNGIAPGLILPSAEEEVAHWDTLVNRLPMKKQGDPTDVVEAVLFLINQTYITGEILFIDGGYQLI
ncbi:MAG: SDR family oxidoreductase [Anaerolineaceae bacterium]|nr:SDR family oxidoreductase [Anaerolineaceae bacterium]